MRKNRHPCVLITAGGTYEDIDTVRGITNHATGRLGSLIADIFIQNGIMVTYLCGAVSILPTQHACEVIQIRGVAGLTETLNERLQKNLYDCVIHSMAVSDFAPHTITTLDDMVGAIQLELNGEALSEVELSARIRNAILNSKGHQEKKISSKSSELIITLKQTPKVIKLIKAIQPHALLVGFKLLSGVLEAELLEAGKGLITNSGCDYVVANDLSTISGDKHRAILLDEDGILRRAETKHEIARMVFETVMERLECER